MICVDQDGGQGWADDLPAAPSVMDVIRCDTVKEDWVGVIARLVFIGHAQDGICISRVGIWVFVFQNSLTVSVEENVGSSVMI